MSAGRPLETMRRFTAAAASLTKRSCGGEKKEFGVIGGDASGDPAGPPFSTLESVAANSAFADGSENSADRVSAIIE